MLKEDIIYFCLECSSSFSQDEYDLMKFKNTIFTFGLLDVKCPSCKCRGHLINITKDWSTIVETLNLKGYPVIECSTLSFSNDKFTSYIAFDKPLSSSLKPPSMSYLSNWVVDGENVISRGYENRCVIKHDYFSKAEPYEEFRLLTKKLLIWSKKLPINT